MCGICGAISDEVIDPVMVKKMNKALIHRGPDGEGELNEDGISLAMRRLSIIDLQSGWQPLFNEDHSLALFINGEIYNYVELRKLLTEKGHRFSTSVDGESILHLYEDYGTDCLRYLRGMFAFALWDKTRRQLFIARDRMGEKPLYILEQGHILLFSSELRSLMASGQVTFDLDPVAIDMFFHYHYVPEPYTPLLGVRKLPAGHYVLIDQDTMNLSEECYWKMEQAPPLNGNPSEIIREKLDEIANLVIRADVPVGVALSGGIDSGAIAALAVNHYKDDMHAFTVGYEEQSESDERVTAQKVAAYLNLPFHEIELTNRDFIQNFTRMCNIMDDPIADISAFGYYSVSKAAREAGVPVLLQGQGGDELFWGYPWVRNMYHYAQLKKGLLKGKKGFADYYMLKFRERYTKPNLKKFTKGLLGYREAMDLYNRHRKEKAQLFPFYDCFEGFNWPDKFTNAFYGNRFKVALTGLNAKSIFTLADGWSEPEITLTKLISTTYLRENGIAQGDRLSMANSVELRLPLVDYQLVETVIGLRKNHNDALMPGKAWLNGAIQDLLPPWLFTLRKRGFEPPVKKWMELLLQDHAEILAGGQLVQKEIINGDMAERLSQGLINPKVIFPVYFSALVLEHWLQNIHPGTNT